MHSESFAPSTKPTALPKEEHGPSAQHKTSRRTTEQGETAGEFNNTWTECTIEKEPCKYFCSVLHRKCTDPARARIHNNDDSTLRATHVAQSKMLHQRRYQWPLICQEKASLSHTYNGVICHPCSKALSRLHHMHPSKKAQGPAEPSQASLRHISATIVPTHLLRK